MPFDLPATHSLWTAPKPAIIRAAGDVLNRHDRRAIEREFGIRFPEPQKAMLPGMVPIATRRYHADAADLDGTNDYLTRGAGFTGAADSKLFTLSVWINPDVDGTTQYVIHGTDSVGGGVLRTRFFKSSANRIGVLAVNSAATTVCKIDSSDGSILAADGWVHVLISFDLSDTAKRHIYINDVSDLVVTTYVNDTIDYTWSDWGIGAKADGTSKVDGGVADLLWWPGVFVDLSITANRRLFTRSDGKPVDPLAIISNVGTPLVAHYGEISDWHTNKGSGGGMTENGALTDAASSPSD